MPISPTLITHAEVVLVGTCAAGGSNSRAVQSVWHFRRTGTALPLSKTNLNTIFWSTIGTAVIAALNVRYTNTNIWVRWLDDALDAYQIFTRAGAGAVTGDSMPTDNAAFLLFQTGLRGKSYRGSKHFFPISESATTTGTDDLFNAGMLTLLGAIATAAAGNLTDASGNVWVPCVYSKVLSQAKANPTTIITNDVTSVLVKKTVGSMTHRKAKSVY